MAEITTEEQIHIWKEELAVTMTSRQWKRALQLCSWLRYALEQRGHSDPEVEQMHGQAKEALAEQVTRERAERVDQREHRRLRRMTSHQINSRTWMQALDSIEALYQSTDDQQETLGLLQHLDEHLTDRLFPAQLQEGTRAAALRLRYAELVERVRADS